MAINITAFDEDVFFAANTAVNYFIFFAFILPTFILGTLCIYI